MELDIQQRLSAIEEQLDRLDYLIDGLDICEEERYSETTAGIVESLGVIRSCNGQVSTHVEENVLWDKSFPLELIMQRLLKFIIREAKQRKVSLTIAQFVEGKIPHSMAESVMTSVMAGLRVVLDRIGNVSAEKMRKGNRLQERCLFVQMVGDRESFYVRIMDDCAVDKRPAKQETEFQRVREAVSRKEGVCSFSFRKNYGFELILKAPMPQTKIEAFMIGSRANKFGILGSLVLAVDRKVTAERLYAGATGVFLDYKNGKIPLCHVTDVNGLQQIKNQDQGFEGEMSVLIAGAADYLIAILADDFILNGSVRITDADRFVSASSWYSRILIRTELESTSIYPLLDGKTLLSSFKAWSKAS